MLSGVIPIPRPPGLSPSSLGLFHHGHTVPGRGLRSQGLGSEPGLLCKLRRLAQGILSPGTASLIFGALPHMKPTVVGGSSLVIGLPACLTPADWQVMYRAKVKVMDGALRGNGRPRVCSQMELGLNPKLCGPGQFTSSS